MDARYLLSRRTFVECCSESFERVLLVRLCEFASEYRGHGLNISAGRIIVATAIGDLGPFRLLTRGDELPAFAFTTAPDITAFNVFDVSKIRLWENACRWQN